jgi:hypothetical protein
MIRAAADVSVTLFAVAVLIGMTMLFGVGLLIVPLGLTLMFALVAYWRLSRA